MWSQDKSLEQVGLTDFELFFIEILFDKTGTNSARSNISGSRETESCKGRSHKTNEQKRKLAGERNGRCDKSKTSCDVPKRFEKIK